MKKKLIAIGDIHGRNCWQNLRDVECDFFIFMGDYFDASEDISTDEEIINFLRILKFKREFPEKVILLFGNHDFHYLKNSTQMYSRYNFNNYSLLEDSVEIAMKENLFQICFKNEHFLFSHAGITKTWLENVGIVTDENLVKNINSALYENPQIFEFKNEINRKSNGNNVYQSPIWVRPESLQEDALEDCIHVIGHTKQQGICQQKNVVLIDVLGSSNEYLCIENYEISVVKF